ncbi:MAG TPA: multiheme c-type cytochrome [Bryobacteraceae bacterium]|nr:multiheme c-type cytochrome [Bryobacteraceae bacterium]
MHNESDLGAGVRRALQTCLALAALASASPAAGPSACAACHPAQAQWQPQNAMANTIQLPASQEILKANPKLTFEKNSYSYTIERKGDVSIYTVRDGARELSLPIQYAFGVHSQNFVFPYQGRFYESMVSYYPKLGGLAITLGDEQLRPRNLVEAMGRQTSNEEIVHCFDCHSTNGVNQGRVTLDTLTPGVACERCHTGAAAHMEAAANGKAAPLPARLSQMGAEDQANFCGQCHRTWEFVVSKREWGEVNVRFTPYRLANSECFLGEDKRIRCTACHDPHGSLARDEAGYDRACLACHASKPLKSCPVSKNNCVSCHMPKVILSDGHDPFTDHQIRIVRPGDPYPN